MKIEKYTISKPNKNFRLKDYDPSSTLSFDGGKEKAEKRLAVLKEKLSKYQELFAANANNKLLIVLQGMDTAGKDGTISHVFSSMNPQGVNIASFKAPTRIDLMRDFLWRIHFMVPAKGEIRIFNRSHYEDVLAVRVHNLCPKEIWKNRYEHINNFEKMLVDEGATILKFFLHISQEEQTARLKARLDEDKKQWKLSKADVEERKYWCDYQEAYEAIMAKTSTKWAPWHIVPANEKWFRNLYVSEVIADTFKKMKLKTPKPDYNYDEMKAELES